MKGILTILFFLQISCLLNAQEDPFLKKHGAYKKNYTLRDSSIVTRLNKIAGDSSYTNPSMAERIGRKTLKIARSIEFQEGECSSLLTLATSKVYSNDFDSALVFANRAHEVAKGINSTKWTVKSLEMIGNIHVYDEKYKTAIDYLLKATRIAEKKDPKLLATIYGNMAHVFKMTDNKEKSWDYCQKTLRLGKKYADTGALMTAYNIMGLIKRNTNYDEALGYFQKGLDVAEKKGHIKRQSELLYNMSTVYFDKGDTDKGFDYFNRSIEISKSSKSYKSIAISYHAMAFNYYDIGDDESALRYADSALKYAMLSGNYDIIIESHALKANLYAFAEDFYNGMTHLSYAYDYKDSLNLVEVNGAISEAEAKYESEKRDLKLKLERKREKQLSDQKIRSRETLLWLAAIALLLFGVSAFFLRTQNKMIKAKNTLVESQKIEIEAQHSSITESIRYAERIQASLLPSQSDWGVLREQITLFFSPRDLVSGDFYWAHHHPESKRTYFAVADCTGHGVPGSLVSMLAISSLNEIVSSKSDLSAGAVLGFLRERIIKALTKDDKTAKDGLDISLCIYHEAEQKIEFAGANNNLWIIRRKELMNDAEIELEFGEYALLEIAGDRMPIGEYLSILPDFKTSVLPVSSGDQLVLYTDGFADQFGGKDNKKYKYAKLKRFLLEQTNASHEGVKQQVLEQEFRSWKGDNEQTDDVCLLVLKL
jgi:serine phosphatase RsbU (regulator of sigma subunit)/tetratricopeptide (TPR) repeat protein